MLRVRDLSNNENCGFRGFMATQNFSSQKNKHYHMAVILKKLFKQLTLSEMSDSIKVKATLKDLFNPSFFVSQKEYEVDLALFTAQIVRYAKWEQALNRKVLDSTIAEYIEVENETIKVDADLIIEGHKGGIEIIKVKRKSPEMTYRGRKKDTNPKQSLELYFMQKLGEKLYPGKEIIPTIVYLQAKKDKGLALEDFETKKGINIISQSFEQFEAHTIEMELRVKRILNEKVDKNSDKCGEKCDLCEYRNLCHYTHIDNSGLNVIPKVKKAGRVSFTPQQKDFIRAEYGYYRTNAVAGSGKTTVIANRIIEMLKNGYSPKEFLLITFTEKGVQELKEKMIFWLEAEGMDVDIVNDIAISTFNGFGNNLAKSEYQMLGFTAEPDLIDKVDKVDIVKKVLDSVPQIEGLNYRFPILDMWKAKGAIIETINMIDKIKTDGYTFPEELVEVLGVKEEYANAMMSVYLKYTEELKMRNLLEYQDQINFALDILSNEEMIEKYGFKNIVIDEFQDTDQAQLYIIKQLTRYSDFQSLIVCGDDSQSIYSFRGTSQENILNFHTIFHGVKDITLKHNFRSTKQISKLANRINDLNTKRINKNIVSNRSGVEPVLYKMGTEEIVSLIKDKIVDGTPLYEIGVIARTKAELLEIEKALKIEGIPCLLAVSELLRNNDKVKNIIGYSKFLADTSLDLHFAEYLQVAKNKEFERAKDIKSFVLSEKESLLAYYEGLEEPERVSLFYKSLEEVENQDRVVKRLLDVCRFKGFITIRELSEFLTKVENYKSEIAVEKDDNVYDAVVLTTAHASKGREFEVVIGLMDKFDYNEKVIGRLEEERRLLFVVVTRAKEELYLIHNETSGGFVEEVRDCLTA